MNIFLQRFFLMLFLAFLLTACFQAETPQDVTKDFWDAVIENKPGSITEYSTLSDPQKYDAFSKDWTGYQSSWGKVVIDGNKASIESEFYSPANSGLENRKFTTYLVLIGDEWKVDYDRTAIEVKGGAFGTLLDRFSQMGEEFSQQMQYSADEFNSEMDRLSRDLEEKSYELNRQAEEALDRYSKELQTIIKEMDESINRALEEFGNKLSGEDKKVLTEVSDELARDGEELSDPTVESVVTSSTSVGYAHARLQSVDNDSLSGYQQQWQALADQFKEDVQQLLAELTSSNGSDR
jgi:hypothetical protein